MVVDLGPLGHYSLMAKCVHYMAELVILTCHFLALNGTQTFMAV